MPVSYSPEDLTYLMQIYLLMWLCVEFFHLKLAKLVGSVREKGASGASSALGMCDEGRTNVRIHDSASEVLICMP